MKHERGVFGVGEGGEKRDAARGDGDEVVAWT